MLYLKMSEFQKVFERKVNSFEELLQLGRRNFDSIVIDEDGTVKYDKRDLTGLENSTITGKYFQQLRDLNTYMYTTWSQPAGRYTLAFGGVIPLKTFFLIQPKLIQQGYWYVAKHPIDQRVCGFNLIPLDEFDSEMAEVETCKWFPVRNETRGEKMCLSNDGREVLVKDRYYLYTIFIDSETVKNAFLSDEIVSYSEEKLFQGENPLISISIEDPILGRNSLYRKMYQFLEEASNNGDYGLSTHNPYFSRADYDSRWKEYSKRMIGKLQPNLSS